MGFNFTPNQVRAMLDLYKVAPSGMNRTNVSCGFYGAADQLERGLLFVSAGYVPVPVDQQLLDMAEELYGIDPDAINATFYKDADFVLGKSRWELFVEQCIHYAGTYGRAAQGLQPLTLVPVQELDIPDVDVSNIKVTVIRIVNEGQIVNLVNDTMMTVKTPSNRIVEAIKELIPYFDAPLEDIRSFEVAIIAYENAGLVPVDGKAFLRYLIYKTTGDTLIVNNRRTAEAIENKSAIMGNIAARLFAKANMVSLAQIFLRYKNLFLAYKHHEGCAPYINRLRRLANTYHRPLSDVSVQNYIALALQKNRSADLAKLRDKMDNREMVKVINSMCARIAMTDTTPGVFNVRNGRSFCKSDAFEPLEVVPYDRLNHELEVLFAALCARLRPSLDGKTFYIPEYVNYTVPTTEKQYVGNFPWGTSFTGPADVENPDVATTVGVQWVNPNDQDWVDLDLHCFTADGQHFGWNAGYYSNGGECVYSGDMTNAPAPLGAAEAFWIRGINVPVIFTLNEYRGPNDMPFKLALSTEDLKARHGGPYVMDPNKLVFAPVPLKFHNNTSMTLGFLADNQFFLYSGNLSEGAVPRGNFQKYIEGIVFQQENKMLMRNLLMNCGATVADTPEVRDAVENRGVEVIDLSPEVLTASTLLDIIDGKTV